MVRKLLNSLQKEDAQAYISCYEPGFLDEQLAEAQASDGEFVADKSVEDVLNMVFDQADMKFIDGKLKAESSEEDSAEVTLNGGVVELTVSDEMMQDMDREELQEFAEVEDNTIKMDFSDEPLTLELVKKNGNWYIITRPLQQLQEEHDI